ncbi:MAG TPA: HlyD family efflux transporter periplasmic adaptor subunit [Gemmatimonadaceae bacterium]|nr:HlyD family efflux transporter periplasmic adaptor subunit [Gemmatimonadaceae bacterium]
MRHLHLSTRSATCAAALTALIACRKTPEPDAYGHLEAPETVVAAQSSGQLTRFVPAEGARLLAGAPAAVVDTSALMLQLEQIAAQRSASSSRVAEAGHQIAALDAQATVARRSYARARRLFEQQAATAQQLDQAERDFRTLVAQRAGAEAQREVATREASSTDARVAQIRDQIAKSHVASPISGTVLTTYVRAGEFVQVGQPLFKIAALDTMELRAYVTESQLSSVKLGQQARVSVDAGGARRALTGVVTWISTQAEFTPTPIQTRDERTNLVYAVKLRVANADGALKIGMPADVELGARVASR